MVPPNLPPDSPRAWLAHAKSDLLIARMDLPEGAFYEGLCWHCLQAAEKALKGTLIHLGVSYPRTHIIEKLLDLIPRGIEIPEEVKKATELSIYLITRYPGNAEEVSREEYLEAIEAADQVVRWAETILNR